MINAFFEYEFIRHAFFGAFWIGLIAPTIGVFVILKRLSNITDSIGHINMSGITFGYFMTTLGLFTLVGDLFWSLLFSIIGALAIEYIRGKYKSAKEVSIVIVYSLAVAMTSIFIALGDGFNSSLWNVLFGNVNSISTPELIMITIISIITLVIIKLNYRRFMITSLNEEVAHLYGVNYKVVNYLFMILLAIVISISVKLVGVLMVSSLITIPTLAAMNISQNIRQVFIRSIIISELALFLGLILAYILDLPSGAVIVILILIIYIMSFGFKKSE